MLGLGAADLVRLLQLQAGAGQERHQLQQAARPGVQLQLGRPAHQHLVLLLVLHAVGPGGAEELVPANGRSARQ